MEKQVRHKPGVLKHQNKTHKTGKHRSKGEIRKENKGKLRNLKYGYSWTLFFFTKSNR
jgi:hypothetical protein